MEQYRIGGLVFEWDDEKNESNLEKHGLDFSIAALAFQDENHLEFYDTKHSTIDEDRYLLIGMVDELLFVVYTVRGGMETNRIISARLANTLERKLYYGID